MAGRRIKIEREYYGQWVSYNSELGFIFTDWWLPQTRYFFDNLLQKKYERSISIRYDRIKILESILEKTFSNATGVDKPAKLFSLYDIAEGISGSRLRKHSRHSEVYFKYKLMLESLVISGELEPSEREHEHAYRVTGKAITTLVNEVTEERRHQEMKRLTTCLVVLTAGLIVTGLMAAWPIFSGT